MDKVHDCWIFLLRVGYASHIRLIVAMKVIRREPVDVVLAFIPLFFIALGYAAFRSGLWTHPWSEADLLSTFDRVLGDAKV